MRRAPCSADRAYVLQGRANAGGVGEKEGKREGREDSGEDGETRPGAGAKDGTLQGLVQCLPFPAVRRL